MSLEWTTRVKKSSFSNSYDTSNPRGSSMRKQVHWRTKIAADHSYCWLATISEVSSLSGCRLLSFEETGSHLLYFSGIHLRNYKAQHTNRLVNRCLLPHKFTNQQRENVNYNKQHCIESPLGLMEGRDYTKD